MVAGSIESDVKTLAADYADFTDVFVWAEEKGTGERNAFDTTDFYRQSLESSYG